MSKRAHFRRISPDLRHPLSHQLLFAGWLLLLDFVDLADVLNSVIVAVTSVTMSTEDFVAVGAAQTPPVGGGVPQGAADGDQQEAAYMGRDTVQQEGQQGQQQPAAHPEPTGPGAPRGGDAGGGEGYLGSVAPAPGGGGGRQPGEQYNYPAFMPGDAELATMMRNSSVGVFTAYNGVSIEQFNAIFAESGISASDYYQTASMITPAELEHTLSTGRINDRPVPMGIKVKIRHAFLVMRYAAGVPEPPPLAQTPAPVAQTTTVVMGTSEQALAAMQPGEVTGHGLIPLSETVLAGPPRPAHHFKDS